VTRSQAIRKAHDTPVLAIPVAVGALTILRRRLNGPLQLHESKKEPRGFFTQLPAADAVATGRKGHHSQTEARYKGSVASLRLDDVARKLPHERRIRPQIPQPTQLRTPPRYRSYLSYPVVSSDYNDSEDCRDYNDSEDCRLVG
jgi:hypothetical protein